MRVTRNIAGAALFGAALCAALGGAEVSAQPPLPEGVVVPPRSGQLRNYPCMQCHDKIEPQDAVFPPKAPHDQLVFRHMEDIGHCYSCHDRANRNQLWLVLGQRAVSFDESPLVCGQCHGEKYKDWRLGIHGKQTGGWQGPKQRYGCADCHDPHAPKRAAMQAVAPPPFPKLGIRKKAGHE